MASKLVGAALLVLVYSSFSFADVSWKFIVASDSQGRDNGLNALVLGEIASEIVSHNVDLVLFCGDLVYGNDENLEGRLTWWREVMEPVYDADIAVYPCRGNHDSSGSAPIWQKVFSDLPDNGPAGEKHMTYSVTHENALIVALDEYVNRHEVNQSWLDSQLAANRQPLVFVFGHTPAFQAYHDDCLDDHPDKRDIFWASLRDVGARTYFCGHDHFYDHARVDDGDGDPNNDIHQYIIGTAGANFYSFMPPYDGNNGDYTIEQWYHSAWYGYVLVEVDGLEVTLSWMERYVIDPDDDECGYKACEVWSYSVPPAPITLLSPKGDESLLAGAQYEIRWETCEDANIAYVLIEYSVDNGQNWDQVDTVTDSGSFQWIVPMVDSNECLIRVSDLNDPMIHDSSRTVFTIFQCQGPVVGDVNGDCYVDALDLAILVPNWLECGNPFDPSCALE